jgi:ABC-type transport system substrate-binding protein
VSGHQDRDHVADGRIVHDLNRRELLRLLAACAGVASVAMRGSLESALAQTGGDVRMLIRKPTTLNPLFMTSGNEQQIARAMFGALVKMNDTLEPVPDLAETVEVTPDAKTFTFTLREGLAFSDGEPLTARDVVFTIERAVDKRTGSLWRGRLLAIEGAEAFGDQQAETISGIETPDDRTIVITLAEPNAAFLIVLGDYTGLGILSEHALAEVAPDQLSNHTFLEPSVGGGPFELVTYETDQFIELRPNPSWAGTTPSLDRILLPIRTPAIALAEMERGELDIMRLPPEEG